MYVFGNHHLYKIASNNENLQRQLSEALQCCKLMHVCALCAYSLLEASINVNVAQKSTLLAVIGVSFLLASMTQLSSELSYGSSLSSSALAAQQFKIRAS